MSTSKTNKFFSLIHGGTIQLAPGQKIIPESEYSKVIDSQEMLEKVQEDIVLYRKEQASEMEKERVKARQAGFQEGLKEFTKHMGVIEQKANEANEKLSKMIVPLAINAAKKIVGRETELDKATVIKIVQNTLRAVHSNRQVTIHVNKQDLELFEANKEALKKGFERLETMAFQARDDIKPGDCIIETEAGIINFEMDHKWNQLEQAMINLFEKSEKGEG